MSVHFEVHHKLSDGSTESLHTGKSKLSLNEACSKVLELVTEDRVCNPHSVDSLSVVCLEKGEEVDRFGFSSLERLQEVVKFQ